MAPENYTALHWPSGELATPQGERNTHIRHLIFRTGPELSQRPSWALGSEWTGMNAVSLYLRPFLLLTFQVPRSLILICIFMGLRRVRGRAPAFGVGHVRV